jgi:hypothetical protein
MCTWKESLGIGDEVLLLSDGNGELAHAMGVELDLSNNPVGLDVRSRRYALLAEDGVVKVLNLEEGSTPAPAHARLPSPAHGGGREEDDWRRKRRRPRWRSEVRAFGTFFNVDPLDGKVDKMA